MIVGQAYRGVDDTPVAVFFRYPSYFQDMYTLNRALVTMEDNQVGGCM